MIAASEQSGRIKRILMRLTAVSSHGTGTLGPFKQRNADVVFGVISEQLLLPGIAEPRRWNPSAKQHAA